MKRNLRWQSVLTLGSLMTVGLTAKSALADEGKVKVLASSQPTIPVEQGVVLLVVDTDQGPRLCTGTFVNDHQLLTAAHSVLAERGDHPRIYVAKLASDRSQLEIEAAALSVDIHPALETQESLTPENDLAIVNFPVGSAPSQARIHARSPQNSEPVTLIGVQKNPAIAAEGSARVGASTSWSKGSWTESHTQIKGSQVKAPANQAEDGVLYLEGQIVGVIAQTQMSPQRGLSTQDFVDLHSEENRRFLEERLD